MQQLMQTQGHVHLIDSSFLTEEEEAGVCFYVRRTHLQTGRHKDVPDEVKLERDRQQAFDQAESSRDMTFDEFKLTYADHIAGKVAALKGPRRTVVQDEEDVQNTSQNQIGDASEEEEENDNNPKTPISNNEKDEDDKE